MKVLCIGDVVAGVGCRFLRERLPALKKSMGIDIVICNGENSADGNNGNIHAAVKKTNYAMELSESFVSFALDFEENLVVLLEFLQLLRQSDA